MPYTPTTWVDSQTKLGPTHLNNIEAGIGYAPYGPDASSNYVPIWNGSAWTYGQVANAQVSASAAIALSKLADPGSGKVVTSAGSGAVAAYPPGYQFDRTQITSSISGINTTTEGTATTVIAGGSVTYDGSTLVKVEFFAPNLIVTTSTIVVNFVVLRAAVVVGQARYVVTVDAQGSQVAPYIVAFDTPTAASIAYTVKAFVNANTATVSAGAGGSGALLPAFLRVTKV